MQGYPLEVQMIECKSKFLKSCKIAEKYKLFKLNTNPTKPCFVKVQSGGKAIEVEVWKRRCRRHYYVWWMKKIIN